MQPAIVVAPLAAIMTMKVMISMMAAAWTAFRPLLPSLHAAQRSLLQAMLMPMTATMVTTTALREAASALATRSAQTRPTALMQGSVGLALLAAPAAVVASSWAASSQVALHSGRLDLLLGLQRKTNQLQQRQSWSSVLAGVATAVMTTTMRMAQNRQASPSGLLHFKCLGLALLSGQARLRQLRCCHHHLRLVPPAAAVVVASAAISRRLVAAQVLPAAARQLLEWLVAQQQRMKCRRCPLTYYRRLARGLGQRRSGIRDRALAPVLRSQLHLELRIEQLQLQTHRLPQGRQRLLAARELQSVERPLAVAVQHCRVWASETWTRC